MSTKNQKLHETQESVATVMVVYSVFDVNHWVHCTYIYSTGVASWLSLNLNLK